MPESLPPPLPPPSPSPSRWSTAAQAFASRREFASGIHETDLDENGAARPLTRRERLIALRAIDIPTSVIRRFFQIDGMRMAMLMAFNLFISIVPLAVILFAFVARVRSNLSLSQVMIELFHLKGETARIVSSAFPQTSNVLRVASVIAIVSFAISGFDVASAFQRTFADAWNAQRLRGWRGPVRGGAWFVMVFATFAFGQLLQRGPARYGLVAYLVSVPIVATMNYWFWQVTPRLLLDKELDNRDLRLGAILGMIGSTGLWLLSMLILPGWFSWYGRGFGGIGIALAILSWTYVVSVVWVVIVVVSAVMWQRSADIDEVEEVATAASLRG